MAAKKRDWVAVVSLLCACQRPSAAGHVRDHADHQREDAELAAFIAEELPRDQVPRHTSEASTSSAAKHRFGSFSEMRALGHREGRIIGHVLVRRFADALQGLRSISNDPQTQMVANEAMIRSMLALQLGKRGAFAAGLDFEEPLGCVLAENDEGEPDFACVFAFRGETAAAQEAIGAEVGRGDSQRASESRRTRKSGKKRNKRQSIITAIHRPSIELDGAPAYLDPLGRFSVVSSGAATFDQVRNYLQHNIIDRAQTLFGEIEVVAYPHDVLRSRQARFDEAIDSILHRAPAGTKTRSRAISADVLTSELESYRREATRYNLARLAQFEEIHLILAIDEVGLRLGALAIPSSAEGEGGPTNPKVHAPGLALAQARASLVADQSVQRRALVALPRPAMAAFTTALQPEFWMDEPANQALIVAVTQAWGKLTRHKPERGRAILREFFAQHAATYEPFVALSLQANEASPLHLTWSQKIRAGHEETARKRFRELMTTLRPRDLFGEGAEAQRYPAWTVERQTLADSKLELERLIIQPNALLSAWIDRVIGAQWRADWENEHGPLRFVVERLQFESYSVMSLALAPQTEFLDRLAARSVEQLERSGLAGDAGFKMVAQEHPEANWAFGLNGVQWQRWSQHLAETQRANGTGEQKGSLADVFMTSQAYSDGRLAGQFVVNKNFLAQVQGAETRSDELDAAAMP